MIRAKADIREYYRQITAVDIASVAREFIPPGNISVDNALELHARCPVHGGEGSSMNSFKIDKAKQQWFCHGRCKTGGDVLHFVEFIKTGGTVSKGLVGSLPDSHREARDFLAQRAGLAPLAAYGLSPAEQAAYERKRQIEQDIRSALTALTALYSEALQAPQHAHVRAWLHEHYPIEDATYEALQVGYVPEEEWTDKSGRRRKAAQYELTRGGELSADRMKELGGPYQFEALARTGAFYASDGGMSLPSSFVCRIWFPYWARGHVVYATGRETPWSQQRDAGPSRNKYKKLDIQRSQSADGAWSALRNDWLWNEDVLLTRPTYVVVAEGITDAIALYERGVPVISPVTTQLARHDQERLVERLRAAQVQSVYIAPDNEINGVGFRGALKTAALLEAARIPARLVELPLTAEQRAARERLAALGIQEGCSSVPASIAALPEGARAAAQADVDSSKVDVASYFLRGVAPDDFQTLLSQALAPVEFSIDRLPAEFDAAKSGVDAIMAAAAHLDAGAAESALKRLALKFGRKAVSLSTLRAMLGEAKRAIAAERRAEALRDPQDCRELVRTVLAEHRGEGTDGHKRAAEAAYNWWVSHGAKFFFTRTGSPFMYLDGRIYWLASDDRGQARFTAAMLLRQTDIAVDDPKGRVFRSVLGLTAMNHGEERETFTWLHTDVANYRIWISLANKENQILRIDGDGVAVLANGDNTDGVVLQATDQVEPIEWSPDVGAEELAGLLEKHVTRAFTCDRLSAEFVTLWIQVYGLLEFAGTRPLLRAEGAQGSGKTMAGKVMSALLYRREEPAFSTGPAAYTDASTNPLVVLDNIEAADFSEDRKNFLLTQASGVVKQKRAAGTDTGLVRERGRCLIFTSGIEPIGAQLPELLSRSFVINFADEFKLRGADAAAAPETEPDEERAENDDSGLDSGADAAPDDGSAWHEKTAIAELQAARSRILSGLFARWSRILAFLKNGGTNRILRLFARSLGRHSKERCNDYLLLMYAALIVDLEPAERARWTKKMHPNFKATIEELNKHTDEQAQESSPIATALSGLFSSWRGCERAGGHELTDKFRVDYPIEFEPGGARTYPVTARALHLSLSRYAAQQRIRWPFSSAVQLTKRIKNDLRTLESAGFRVTDLGFGGKNHCTRFVIEDLSAGRMPQQTSFPSSASTPDNYEERWP